MGALQAGGGGPEPRSSSPQLHGRAAVEPPGRRLPTALPPPPPLLAGFLAPPREFFEGDFPGYFQGADLSLPHVCSSGGSMSGCECVSGSVYVCVSTRAHWVSSPN